MWAIIGSSGFEHFDEFEVIEELPRETPYGLCSNGLQRVRYQNQDALFLCRTGYEQNILPSHINYRANIFALKKYGATAILALSSVRSIQSTIKPGDLVVPYQYIDRTKALRECTFCDDSLLGYISLSQPISEEIAEKLKEIRAELDFQSHFSSVYVCIEGPQFPTMVEARCYQTMGGSVIGTTAFPEYALAREAGLHYLPCHFVVDYVPWSTEHHPFESVLQIRFENQAKALSIINCALNNLCEYAQNDCFDDGLAAALTTPEEMLTPNQKAWVSVITSSNAHKEESQTQPDISDDEFYHGTSPLPKKLADFLRFINKHKAGKKELTLEEVRKNADSLVFYADKAPEVKSVREFTVKAGSRLVKVRLYHPNPEKHLPIIVYAHGGGFVSGNLDSFDTPLRELALHTNRVVLSVDYHLAPEYPFPTQIEDVEAVIQWAYHYANDIKATNESFVVMGDSAGANLVAMATSRLKEKEPIDISAQILSYPTVDFSHSTKSMQKFAHGYLLESDQVSWYNKQYLPEDMDKKSPEASPLYVNNLDQMPTTFVMTVGYDPLRDEGLIYLEKLKLAGVTVRHYHFDNLIHGFINFSKLIPHEMQIFYNRVAAFIKQL
ncbi:alpha/beta hydrolase fold domain-containing protein [Thiotrichales bacterium 19S11-10]|nr:alpha/beta hydrolase fold domain-containing protein [Thiotrichales bacterium 19S11-10]